jgi:hypothetical protein
MLLSGGNFSRASNQSGVTLFAIKGLHKKAMLNGVFTANSLVTQRDREQNT